MITKKELESQMSHLIKEYGEWTYDIPLPYGLWTAKNQGLPHTRLKRIIQIINDVLSKPISSCRILDLGCLDGIFSIEFALQGAHVIGIDAREANIKKALFAKDALNLNNLEFIQDDVRNISVSKYGRFEVIICSGILYHLNTPDVFILVEQMYEMVKHFTIIDTSISIEAAESVSYKGKKYYGHTWREHKESDTEETKLKRLWRAFGNDISFRFTRPSLINCLSHLGFSSVYECFNPPHLNFGKPGIENEHRCTFLAIKKQECELHTSPMTNHFKEYWPEGSLSYTNKKKEFTPATQWPEPYVANGF